MNVLADKLGEQVAPSVESHRILAIDYGRKRIGLALSDKLGLTAQPLAVVVRKNRVADLKRLREICAEHSVGRIIVGYPVHITGEAGDMAREAEAFATRLIKALHIETEMVDERLTSWEARQTVAETKGRAAARRGPIDDVAAAVLLRDYLDHRREAPCSAAERD
jgi:putative Holliday junction resolvase